MVVVTGVGAAVKTTAVETLGVGAAVTGTVWTGGLVKVIVLISTKSRPGRNWAWLRAGMTKITKALVKVRSTLR
jgi:hypothetical protein